MLFGVWRPPIFQSSNPENNHLIYLYFNPIQTNPFSCQIFFKKKHPVLVQAWNLCSPFVLHSVQVFVNLLIAIIKKKKKESFLFNNFSWSKVRRVHSISPHKSKLNLGKRTTFPFIKPRGNNGSQSVWNFSFYDISATQIANSWFWRQKLLLLDSTELLPEAKKHNQKCKWRYKQKRYDSGLCFTVYYF